MGSAERKWLKGAGDRARARHEQVQAEAQAGAASLVASGILGISENGAEAVVRLRPGAILTADVPGMGVIATIKAGDGWATAVISPRVLNGAPGSGGTGDAGDGVLECMTPGSIAPYVPGALQMSRVDLAPLGWAKLMQAALRDLFPGWPEGRIVRQARQIYEDLSGAERRPACGIRVRA